MIPRPIEAAITTVATRYIPPGVVNRIGHEQRRAAL
jgi:hypothetical protein